MNSSHDDAIEFAGAYVLDALDPDELVAFEAHLATCAVCQVEVADLRQVVDILPLAVESVVPPDSLRERVLRELSSEPPAEERPRLTAIPGGAPERTQPARNRSRWRAGETWLAAVAAVVILALGGWNIQLRQQNNNSSNTATAILLDAVKNGATISPVGHTASAPLADAEFVQPRKGAPAFFAVRGLPKTPNNNVYEIWLLRGQTSVKAATFTYAGGSDWQVVRLPSSARGYVSTAVTNEPSPNGSLQPTGQQYLAGKLSA